MGSFNETSHHLNVKVLLFVLVFEYLVILVVELLLYGLASVKVYNLFVVNNSLNDVDLNIFDVFSL